MKGLKEATTALDRAIKDLAPEVDRARKTKTPSPNQQHLLQVIHNCETAIEAAKLITPTDDTEPRD